MKKSLIIISFIFAISLYAKSNEKTYLLCDTTRYSEKTGYGYDIQPTPTRNSHKPFYFSVHVPDGNYLVTVRLGNKKIAGNTTVRAESRRLYIQKQITGAGEFIDISFLVNKRTAIISGKEVVKIKDREKSTLTWDDKLTLEFNGDVPVCESIKIEAAPNSTTVFLCGNSTVVDQPREPWASWGQMIPAFFNDQICFANHAESGLSANSFISGNRLKKILSQIKNGDYVLIEFGHNDQKQSGPGIGAYYSFMTNLKIFIDEVRAKSGIPVLVTPTQRRRFDESGHNQNTHGEYPDAIRWLATKENVPLIDLNQMTNIMFEAMGEESSKNAFVHYPANTFPGQKDVLADNTHFNTYGAYEVAKCVATGIQNTLPGIASYLKPDFLYSPESPDSFDAFYWPQSPFSEIEKPEGN